MMLGHSLADEEGTILAIDEALADLLHRPIRTILGKSYLGITHPLDHARNQIWVAGLASGYGAQMLRKRYLRADGESVWLEVGASRLTQGLDAGRLLGTFRLPDRPTQRMPERLWRAALEAVQIERQRRDSFGSDLVGNPTWSILLQLYIAEAEGRELDIADLRNHDGIPSSTLLRWLKVFEERGLVERGSRTHDGHQLTSDGAARVEDLLFAQIVR